MANALRWVARAPRRAAALTGFAGLVLASNWMAAPPPPPDPGAGPGRSALDVASFDDAGPVPDARARLSAIRWEAAAGPAAPVPVLCLHGSPGSARNFELVAPRLSAAGRDVWALDLPGFGRSSDPAGGRSILAHARAARAALDALGLERVHLVAWSMGGGVALHLAELAPERVASIALVASIGVQETEGTGVHAAELAKYLALRLAVEGLDAGLPHFGRWSFAFAHAREFARNFQETDQRPLRAILEGLETPLLIVHGDGDVLASARTAAVSHALVRHSRLVLLEGNHFLPFTHVEALAEELAAFQARHDVAGAREPRSQRLDAAEPRGVLRLEPWPFELGQRVPAALQGALWLAAGALAPLRAALVAGLALASLQFDPGWTALTLGLGVLVAAWRGRRLRLLALAPAALLGVWLGCSSAAAWLSVAPGRASAAVLVVGAGATAWRYRARARVAEEGQTRA